MSATRFDIDRIALTLRGVAGAESFAPTLEAALADRLGALRPAGAARNIGTMDLGVLEASPGTDARALADAIAGRIVDWIGRQAGDHEGEAT